MASERAESVAKQLERAFAYSDWTGFRVAATALYEQGVADGGGSAGSPVPSVALPEAAPPPPPPKPKEPPPPDRCPACEGRGERTVTLLPGPDEPGRPPRASDQPMTCPDCRGTGSIPGMRPAATVAPVPAATAGTRFVVVGDRVIDRTVKKVEYQGPDAADIAEALNA